MFKIIFISFNLMFFLSMAKTQVKPVAKSAAVKKDNSLDLLVDELQKVYNNANSASFSFSQKYQHPIFPKTDETRGIVHYKKPNKMLWDYQIPIAKSFFINGTSFHYYLPKDKIAYKHDCFKEDTLSASISFLWGKGNLKTSFNISFLNSDIPNKDLRWLNLVPKEKQTAIKAIYLGVDKKSPNVKESMVIDSNNGKNHFVFTNLKLNSNLKDEVFVFKPPKGIKIEKMPNQSCAEKK